MEKKSLLTRGIYLLRDLHSRPMFEALKKYCRGDVLDVGGWDFFLTAKEKNLTFDRWTVLEASAKHMAFSDDERLNLVLGDGCDMAFQDGTFDTVLNIHVLEHVLEPIKMVEEIKRVLKPGGHAVFLLPQTSDMHLAPDHYYNFTRFWITRTMERAGLEIVERRSLGGIWSSMASHFLFFFFQSARYEGMSVAECRRNLRFYLLYPFMAMYAAASIPVCLTFALGDLSEEPNNHLVIARKPLAAARSAATTHFRETTA